MEKFNCEKYGLSELTTNEKQNIDAGCLITLFVLYHSLVLPLYFFGAMTLGAY